MEKEKILVVEDDDEIREMIALGLENAGYRVISACNGKEARHYLSLELPDLIILDVLLPDIDGITLCKSIRKDERTHRVPVLMATALSDFVTTRDAMAMGASDLLTKPFDMKDLFSKIDRIFISEGGI